MAVYNETWHRVSSQPPYQFYELPLADTHNLNLSAAQQRNVLANHLMIHPQSQTF